MVLLAVVNQVSVRMLVWLHPDVDPSNTTLKL